LLCGITGCDEDVSYGFQKVVYPNSAVNSIAGIVNLLTILSEP
jgi:hypothetical protein